MSVYFFLEEEIVTFDAVNRGIRTLKEVSMFRFALRIHVFFAKNKIIANMFFVKNNLSVFRRCQCQLIVAFCYFCNHKPDRHFLLSDCLT